MKQFLTILAVVSLSHPILSQHVLPDHFQNEVYELKNVDLGIMSPGRNIMTVSLTNHAKTGRNCVIDIRTECLGLGRVNWQAQHFYSLAAAETHPVSLEYTIVSPMIRRIVIRFGNASKPFDIEKWSNLPPEERELEPFPEIEYLWTCIVEGDSDGISPPDMERIIAEYEVMLTDIPGETFSSLREDLPEMIRRSRHENNVFRSRLRTLITADRTYPDDFNKRTASWAKNTDFYNTLFSRLGAEADVFSIAGESGQRITAFFATLSENASERRPLIILMSGNPPGTKESLVSASLYFCRLGFHTVGIDRRESARVLDTKEKFLSNFTDPVADVLRLIDYISSRDDYAVSKIGLYGFSAGAGEAKFAAALDDRIEAVVLACGITSYARLFDNRAWIPTLSGMIIYPELGLGNPPIGNMSSEEFWMYFEKATPEHNRKARDVFNEVFPFFEDMFPERVVPLIAPVPMMIVTGARDDQFTVAGVVDVDQAAMEAYAAFNTETCSELIIQPRTGHTVTTGAGCSIAAFFQRWLF